jgi:hypothetical protein
MQEHTATQPPRQVLPFVPRQEHYATGYRAGVVDGERHARQMLFWVGMAAGVLLVGVIALAIVLVWAR